MKNDKKWYTVAQGITGICVIYVQVPSFSVTSRHSSSHEQFTYWVTVSFQWICSDLPSGPANLLQFLESLSQKRHGIGLRVILCCFDLWGYLAALWQDKDASEISLGGWCPRGQYSPVFPYRLLLDWHILALQNTMTIDDQPGNRWFDMIWCHAARQSWAI